eukprot:6233888-Pyramimonas_sp.AAC.1
MPRIGWAAVLVLGLGQVGPGRPGSEARAERLAPGAPLRPLPGLRPALRRAAPRPHSSSALLP